MKTEKPRTWRQRIDPVVFTVTGAFALGFVIWGLVSTPGLASASGSAEAWVISHGGWFFVLAASFFVVFVLWLAAGKFGKIPLGDDDEEPEFRTISWIAMMFSAGMGIGLMFFAVAEPLSHYADPPPGTAEAESAEALQVAMATTMFHWALHPWAIYAVVGLAIAYGTFRRKRRQLVSAAFIPLFGKRAAAGPAGRVIDILAIFATLFGSAASLGLGALQIGAGLRFNGWVDSVGKVTLVLIIVVLTICFIISAVSGVARGIQWLANTNMVLAVILAVFIFVVGPTLFILNLLPTSLGDYLSQFVDMAARTDASGDEAMQEWLSAWTIFYWAWWISWTPFVGMFIARISRGRTIRQFVTGVLLVPSLVSLVWFAIFGGAAIDRQRVDGDMVPGNGIVNSDEALFDLLHHYPLASVMAVLVMVLVAIFFVSGADAASLVMGTLSERGDIEPSRRTVIFWGALTGAVAAIMLVIGGDDALTGLQNITIVASVPFVLVMVLLCFSLVKDLQRDTLIRRRRTAQEVMESAVIAGEERHDGEFALVVEGIESGSDDELEDHEAPPDSHHKHRRR
ncbi:BCCT family transporter [Aeromicrobium piscarium]|uniref:BCCT family transporter n=1 Tax=Aeromicrobium piscarium TaxID=2590901 RepID=UPI001C8F4652|nr:BCCT family transporter [Aeromicrobium piscarium]